MNHHPGRQSVAPSLDISKSIEQAGSSPAPRNALHSFFAAAGLVAVCIAAYLLVPAIRSEINRLIFVLSMADIHAVRGWVESAGAWAPAISIFIMVFQAVLAPLPAVAVTFANAAIFGWAWGAAISWTGAMLGAVVCYWLAIGLGRSLVERYAPTGVVTRLDEASLPLE